MKLCSVLNIGLGLELLSVSAAEGPVRPNIVLILADDMGWGDLGCYGNTYHRTPNIDRLASQGMRFTDAYANAPNCAPSRACLLTGRYEPRHGVYTVGPPTRFDGHEQFLKHSERKLIAADNPEAVPEATPVFPERLREAGYATSLFGKVHALFRPDSHPHMHHISAEDIRYIQRRGFDEVAVSLNFDHLHARFVTDAGPEFVRNKLMTNEMTDRAIRFIERNRNDPFFLYVPDILPHTPIKAPEQLVQKYENIEASSTHSNATYAAMIEMLDKSVGRILDALDDLDLTDNTLVIVSSDNGGATGIYGEPWPVRGRITSNFPLRGQKGQFYEGGIRVPFIARWPGKIKAGTVCTMPIALTDLYPTLLEVAQFSVQEPLDGQSLLPLFKGNPERFPVRALYWNFPGYLPLRTRPLSVIRKGDYKLIENHEDGSLELYNLGDDLSERDNLTERLPELTANLLHDLRQWRRKTGARVPEPNPAFDPANEGRW